MLVYGDRWRFAAPEALLRGLARCLAGEGAAREGGATEGAVDRLTGALVLAGELAQGVADAEAEAAGHDDLTPPQAATLALAVAVAGRLLAACGQSGGQSGGTADPGAALAAAALLPLPARIRCRRPEGYAFYALYPEAYAAAAAAVDWGGRPLVLGIRSIGTSLGAAVAARLGCALLTVRPGGHPFRRELRPSPALAARLRRHDGVFVVVDEGPGLSGSSFGAVADALERLEVAPERIAFMPSHAGALGPQAAPAHRRRWERAVRVVPAGVDADRVRGWFADIVGEDAPAEDLSGGGWRRTLEAAPPAAPGVERLKVRLTGPGGRLVARFAGLGAVGAGKLAVARRLQEAGFGPEPLALRRGFLLERWVEGAPLAGAPDAVVAHLGRYLGFRARALPAGEDGDDGAGPAALRQMAVTNAEALGGAELAGRVERRLAGIERLPRRPVRIDGRLHRWEWLRRADGRLCKTDALDHASAHDLVGCQDIAWDVAGAAVEFGLSDAAAERLRRAVAAAAGKPLTPEAVAAHRLCYAAFQGGLWRMTGEAGAATDRLVAGYLSTLRRAVGLEDAAPKRADAAP